MNITLKHMRKAMEKAQCDAYFVPRSDVFGGEEVRPADERLAHLTGFTGSAGYALILKDRAAVFSDSRYTVQLQRQLDPDLFEGFDAAETSLSDWLETISETDEIKPLVIGYDGWLMSVAQMEKLSSQLPHAEWLMLSENLVDLYWQDRPHYAPRTIWHMPDAQAGKSRDEKVSAAVKDIKDAGADAQLITAPDSVNWLTNIRGNDLAHTPLHLCFGMVELSGALTLIGADSVLASDNIAIQPLEKFADMLSGYEDKTLLMDKSTCPQAVFDLLDAAHITPVWMPDPVTKAKAKKTPAEIDGFRAAHITDALAFASFWHWLETEADLSALQESDLAVKLAEYRATSPDFLSESFPAIVGFKENGAVVHYRAVPGADAGLAGGGVLLIDSGGHYQSGTTDITRTLLLGNAAQPEAIAASTHVLAAHINLAMTKFAAGTTGAQLDAICRAPLWAQSMDYGHGTGHGVGHVLSVHEGPVSISKRSQLPIEAGHILSNEPGYYKEGAYGIRHETLVLAVAAEDGFLGFETLTLVPFDTSLIDAKLLSAAQIQWLNRYHAEIYKMLSPFLSSTLVSWLKGKVSPIG